MRLVQDITFDLTGETVFLDCTEGRPSSVDSCSVFAWDMSDDGTAESAVGSPSVETDPSTTLNDVATAGSRTIPLAATTGVAVDRRYLVTDVSGLKEWVEIDAITDGVSVTTKHPLHNDYASGATFESTRARATIDSTWIADTTNLSTDATGPNPTYRVRWQYTVDGTSYVADTYFNVVRYGQRHGVQPQDIEVMVPGWLDALPTDHRYDQGRKLIDNAYREVRIDMHQVDLAASQVAESEIVDELVRYKTVELGEWAKFYAVGGDSTRAQAATQRYTQRLDALVRIVSRIPVRDETGGATAILPLGLTRR